MADRRLHRGADRQNAFADRRRPAAGRCSCRCSPARRRHRRVGAVIGLAAARLRGPYLAGAHPGRGGRRCRRSPTTFDERLQRRPGPVGAASSRPAGLGPTSRTSSGRPGSRWRGALLTLLLLANLVRSRFGRDAAGGPRRRGGRPAGRHPRRPYPGRSPSWSARPAPGSAARLLAVLAQSVSPGRVLADPVAVPAAGRSSSAAWAAWPARSGAPCCWSRCPSSPTRLTDDARRSRPRLAQRLEGNLPLAIFGLILDRRHDRRPRRHPGPAARSAGRAAGADPDA